MNEPIDERGVLGYDLATYLLPDRLKAGHQFLALGIGVRIPVREP